jgi:uncharacterized membrane protein
MKKVLRALGILLLVLVVAIGLLIAFAPQRYTMERSVTINAPHSAVFGPLTNFHQWPSWTAWGEMDATQKYTFTGTASAPGATYAWTGKEVGSGKMTCTDVTTNRMNYNLDFIEPFQSHNTGWVRAEAINATTTRASMGMEMNSPRPFNAIGWIFKGSVGDDFEKGLTKLKRQIENGQTPTVL